VLFDIFVKKYIQIYILKLKFKKNMPLLQSELRKRKNMNDLNKILTENLEKFFNGLAEDVVKGLQNYEKINKLAFEAI
jgi:hypothetical protein